MSIEQEILSNLQKLPRDQQKEILDFTEFLKSKNQSSFQLKSPQERATAWRQFVTNQTKDTPGLPEEAISRDTMYD